MNLLVFVVAFIMQWGIGIIINQFVSDRIGQYEPEGFQVAFSALIAIQFIAMAWFYFSQKQNAVTDP